jgi:hypothetical protein
MADDERGPSTLCDIVTSPDELSLQSQAESPYGRRMREREQIGACDPAHACRRD